MKNESAAGCGPGCVRKAVRPRQISGIFDAGRKHGRPRAGMRSQGGSSEAGVEKYPQESECRVLARAEVKSIL